jgi:hypothetical protein
MLAQASYALYQSEQHPEATVDWQAALAAGQHAVRGAEALLRSCPEGGQLPCDELLTRAADDVAGRFDRTALGLLRHDAATLRAATPPPPRLDWPDNLGQDLYHLADLRAWLDGLRDDVSRITGTGHRPGEGEPGSAPPLAEEPESLRARIR